MVRVVLSLGIIAAVAGLMALGFGIPIKEFGLGNTLIIAGSTLLSSGLVVIALSLVLRSIERLALGITSQMLMSPVAGPAAALTRAPEGMMAAPSDQRALAPPAERSVPMPAAPELAAPPPPVPREKLPPPAERSEAPRMPRATAWQDEEEDEPLPPLPAVVRPPPPPSARPDRAPQAAPLRAPERPERNAREPAIERPAARFAPQERLSVPADEQEPAHDPYAPPERRRVFGWTRRSKDRGDEAGAPEERSAAPDFGASRAPAGGEARYAPPPQARRNIVRAPVRGPLPAEVAAASGGHAPSENGRTATPRRSENGRPPAQPRVEVLKQGTVDGMSYTLYTDGSIDAEFPEGRIRFSSIDELREHLEGQG